MTAKIPLEPLYNIFRALRCYGELVSTPSRRQGLELSAYTLLMSWVRLDISRARHVWLSLHEGIMCEHRIKEQDNVSVYHAGPSYSERSYVLVCLQHEYKVEMINPSTSQTLKKFINSRY